jgi:hypothetical protein
MHFVLYPTHPRGISKCKMVEGSGAFDFKRLVPNSAMSYHQRKTCASFNICSFSFEMFVWHFSRPEDLKCVCLRRVVQSFQPGG